MRDFFRKGGLKGDFEVTKVVAVTISLFVWLSL